MRSLVTICWLKALLLVLPLIFVAIQSFGAPLPNTNLFIAIEYLGFFLFRGVPAHNQAKDNAAYSLIESEASGDYRELCYRRYINLPKNNPLYGHYTDFVIKTPKSKSGQPIIAPIKTNDLLHSSTLFPCIYGFLTAPGASEHRSMRFSIHDAILNCNSPKGLAFTIIDIPTSTSSKAVLSLHFFLTVSSLISSAFQCRIILWKYQWPSLKTLTFHEIGVFSYYELLNETFATNILYTRTLPGDPK